jgi:hypothetical protein
LENSKKMKPWLLALTLLSFIFLAACASTATAPAPTIAPTSLPTNLPAPAEALVPTQASYPSILPAIPNAEFPIELASTGKAQLKDGVFEEPAAPGSATKTRIWLGKEMSLGDVNGDGIEDVVVPLLVDPGGSGTFTYLALVLNDKGTPRPLATILLGDRILLKSLAIQDGTIVVTMLTRKPDEPMSAAPTVEVVRKFKLQGDKLAEVVN